MNRLNRIYFLETHAISNKRKNINIVIINLKKELDYFNNIIRTSCIKLYFILNSNIFFNLV